MKAFLIDPETRTVTEVEYTGNWRDIYPLIDCDCFTTVDIDGQNTMFLGDNGLIGDKDHHYFAYGKSLPPLVGKALVLGYDEEGETVASTLTLEEVQSQVWFMNEQSALFWTS